MSATNRTVLITKTFKVLKKHFKPVLPPEDRSALEHLLFACCLEDAKYDVAEDAFQALKENFFDWNEMRVSTVNELGDVMHKLPNAPEAAGRLRRCLQSVFETTYSFDIEAMRKEKLGQAIHKLNKLNGPTPFAVAYVTQTALAGHAIPVASGELGALCVLGAISESDKEKGVATGLDRAVSKARGIEFGSLLHQLGAAFAGNPYSPTVHKILLEIEPSCKPNLPRRPTKKQIAAQRAAEAAARRAEAAARRAEEAKAQKAAMEKAAKEKAAKEKAKAVASAKAAAKKAADRTKAKAGHARSATKKTAKPKKKTAAKKRAAAKKKAVARRK